MSGFVGLLNLDGLPVEPELLERMTAAMTFRGPDAQAVWRNGPVGLGHSLLQTTEDEPPLSQPFSLDGQTWLVADARIDDQTTLRAALRATLGRPLEDGPDAVLILLAYEAWNQNCVEHLTGDWAFALWDGPRQRLFCGRDGLGVKPFFYARSGAALLVGNTLASLRLHPAVSDEINEAVVGDFLLFEQNCQPQATIWADIAALPGGHTLTVERGQLQIHRYWSLPTPPLLHYRREGDYLEHFQQLLDEAVSDRLRTRQVALSFSGGLDSTALAATALGLKTRNAQPLDLNGFTLVYDRLIPDQERHYAGIAARSLGLPVQFWVADDYRLYEGWERPEIRGPMPLHQPFALAAYQQRQSLGRHSRVLLYGQGSDEAMCRSTALDIFRGMSPRAAVYNLGRAWQKYRIHPPLGSGLAERYRKWRNLPTDGSRYPVWLNPQFEARQNLPERWHSLNWNSAHAHPLRPEAYQRLTSPLWAGLFEMVDPGASGTPVEVRFPFLDLRMLNFLLALPPLPFFVDKWLLREAMRGKLPEAVRLRSKTPLAGDPVWENLKQGQQPWQDLPKMPSLEPYIDLKQALQSVEGEGEGEKERWNRQSLLRAVSLGYWLEPAKTTPGEISVQEKALRPL